jgi:hypothetical protein
LIFGERKINKGIRQEKKFAILKKKKMLKQRKVSVNNGYFKIYFKGTKER